MTQPSYTTNLTLLDGCDTDTGYAEPTASGWQQLNNETFSETDLFIHAANCISATVKVGVGATMFNNTTGITLGTNDGVSMWAYWAAPNSLATESSGGIRQIIGATTANFDYVVHGGSDTYTYGGWINFVMGSPAQITTTSVGSGTGTTYQYHGWAYNAPTSVPGKGNPYCVDVMRYGRHDIVVEYGDATSGYCNFDEMARANDANDISFTADTTNTSPTLSNISPDTNDLYPGAPISGTGIPASTTIKSITNSTTAVMTANATATNTGVSITSQPYNRWGLFQRVSGETYLWKGLMSIGTATNAVDFRDSNVSILLDNTKNVTSAFNAIEINNASSRVDWTNVGISALGTVSPGTLTVVNNCDVNFDSCSFANMGTFTFLSTSSVLSCTFNNCGLITMGNADFDGSNILSSAVAADEGALYVNETISSPTTITDLDNMTFSKGTNAHHAIRFGTGVTANITLQNIEFTGWSGSTNDSNDSIFRFDATSGSINLNLVGCTVDGSPITTGTATIDDAAGITVTPVVDPVTTKFTVEDLDGNPIENARVFTETADNGGGSGFPFEASITSLTRLSGIATAVCASAHGLVTTDKVVIRGAQPDGYNKATSITVLNSTTFSYLVDSGLTTPATGTIVFSYVPVHGLTNSLGVVQASKTWPASQAIKGWARKSTSSPYYKQTNISVSDASGGTDLLLSMILDE